MKKIAGILIGTALLCGVGGVSALPNNAFGLVQANAATYESLNEGESIIESAAEGLQTRAKSAYLMEYATGSVLYAQNETAHLPIASMCKIMTLLLAFDALDAGVISLDEEIIVSERAASMGGSQVFLEANAKYPVRELIKSIVVCSANDSCVAMAERIAGSESLFVEKMNEKAKAIGANDTLFANCTGLPKEPQYSCAKDAAIMLKNLLSHKEYFEYGKVWMDKFSHPKGRYTEITNTNKLVRFYDGCDGGKTGFTNEAGFCLAATAKRENMRVISVVIGEKTSANRFEDTRTLFDYAFANYTVTPVVEGAIPLEKQAVVVGGKTKSVTVAPSRTASVFSKRGEKSGVTMEFNFNKLKAPVKQGETAGELVLFKDGIEIDRVGLIACESVEKANFLYRLKEFARNWNA